MKPRSAFWFTAMRGKFVKYLALGPALAGVAFLLLAPPRSNRDDASVKVQVPELSALARQGRDAFEANCAACHGQNASGTDRGPPLVHDIYNPGHHADAAFFLAARRGVPQHHWPYGNMPPQPQVGEEEMAAIVHYVRELQRANGIASRQHAM